MEVGFLKVEIVRSCPTGKLGVFPEVQLQAESRPVGQRPSRTRGFFQDELRHVGPEGIRVAIETPVIVHAVGRIVEILRIRRFHVAVQRKVEFVRQRVVFSKGHGTQYWHGKPPNNRNAENKQNHSSHHSFDHVRFSLVKIRC